MKGAGHFKGHGPRDAFADYDERTRRGPIPLTVKRQPATPTPIDANFPIVASEDVDLRTPAPSRSSYGDLAMNPRPHQPSRSYPMIQPTPTFSFTDGPEQAPLWTEQPPPRRRRSGPGFFGVSFLMLAAGLGGYLTVRYRAWQDVGPL